MNDSYKKKFNGCVYLATLDVKKITDSNIKTAANNNNINFLMMKKAWENFQESGGKFIDKRTTTGRYVGKKFNNYKQIKKLEYTKSRTLTVEEVANIIKEYMTTEIGAIDICNKYKIPGTQFYSWIHELDTTGTLLGKTIFNPKKYAKLNIIDVIYFYKHPNTKRKSIKNLTELEKLAYKRVANVLLKYLPCEV